MHNVSIFQFVTKKRQAKSKSQRVLGRTAIKHVKCGEESTTAVSQFRVCILLRTQPLRPSKASPSERPSRAMSSCQCSEHILGMSPDVPVPTLTSRFLPPRSTKVTIYTTRCRHFLSFFLGVQRILGYGRRLRIIAVHPPKTGKRRPHLWAAFGGALEVGQPLCGVVT